MSFRSQPDPSDPTSFNHRYVNVVPSGFRYHLIDQPPLSTTGSVINAPTVLLIHGFPDLWYGYRYQIHNFAARGWRVICPTMLGYGETSQPHELTPYSAKSMSTDLDSLLDECEVKGKVVVVGHDHGGNLAWRFVEWFPHRALCVVVICTPYPIPASDAKPALTEVEMVKKYPHWGYSLYYLTDECADEINQVLDLYLEPMFSQEYKRKLPPHHLQKAPVWPFVGRWKKGIQRQVTARKEGKLPHLPPNKELDYYLKNYRINGIRAALNWYRMNAINGVEEAAAKLGPYPNVPAFMLATELDPALPPWMATETDRVACFPHGNLDVKILEGGDHWCLQDEDTREKVTELLGNWIENVLAGNWKPSGQVLSKL